MKTLEQFSQQTPAIPMATVWLLNDLAEYRGKQELFTKQSPQKLKKLREHALIESARVCNKFFGVSWYGFLNQSNDRWLETLGIGIGESLGESVPISSYITAMTRTLHLSGIGCGPGQLLNGIVSYRRNVAFPIRIRYTGERVGSIRAGRYLVARRRPLLVCGRPGAIY